MFYNGQPIEWNDSLGELKYLQILEINWSDAFLKKDVNSLYDFTFLYFMALNTRAKFDGSALLKKLLQIRELTARIDTNRDGSISAEEKANSAQIFGAAWDNLILIYMELGEIKVKSGWGLRAKSKEQEEATQALKDYPVLNVK